MNLVTVVIPTFNRKAMLAEALATVFKQTLNSFEVLISDNASEDGTSEYLATVSDPRVRVVRQEHNIGGQRNWRFVLCSPTTRYVALLEDDNLWEPDHLERALSALETHPKASIYGARVRSIGRREDPGSVPYWLSSPEEVVFCPAQDVAHMLLRSSPVQASSVVIRRERLASIQYWGGAHWPGSMDFLWWSQLALEGGLVFDLRQGASYRWHDGNWYTAWLARKRIAASDWRYTIRTLALSALQRNLLDSSALVSDAMSWTPVEAATLIVALSAPEAGPRLQAAARELFDRRRAEMRGPGVSGHVRLADRISPLWLRVGDKLDRWLCGWPPQGEDE